MGLRVECGVARASLHVDGEQPAIRYSPVVFTTFSRTTRIAISRKYRLPSELEPTPADSLGFGTAVRFSSRLLIQR